LQATIQDIAKRVGVSKKTVSVALNNKPGVSEKTRKAILKAAEELNYIPNVIAKSLSIKSTRTLGVLIPNLWNNYFSEIIRGIEKSSSKNNYNILLGISNEDSDFEYKIIKMLIGKRVDGLLISPIQKNVKYIKILKNNEIPFILLNYRPDLPNYSYIVNDNVYGGFLAADYLIKKGYRKIYCIFPDTQQPSFMERIEGCKKAFEKNNIPLSNLKLLICERKLSSFYDVTKKNVHSSEEKIGLFVWNDQTTISVYKAIIDMGLNIPKNVGIVGYDDIEFSKFFLPKALTTIRNQGYEMGVKATEILLKKIKSKKSSEIDEVILKPILIVRDSA